MPEQKTLYRSKSNRIIFGVCGGLAKYFGIDTTLVRLIFVLLALADGIGILLYIVLAIVVKEELEGVEGDREKVAKEFTQDVGDKVQKLASEVRDNPEWQNKSRNILGVAIILIGALLLLRQFVDWHPFWLGWKIILSVAAILIGIYLITKNNK